MKTKIVYIIFLVILFLLPNNLSADSITNKQLKTTLLKQIKIDRSQILLFDSKYTDYGNLLVFEVGTAYNQIKNSYKESVFDCDDIAFYIKTHVSYKLSKQVGKGAVLIGMACLEIEEKDYHAVNIFIIKNNIYIFDGQIGNIYTIEEYLETDIRFFLIII